MGAPDMLPRTNSKTLDAEIRCSQWLARANELDEAGKARQAEAAFAKSQYWLDRYNKLAGNA